MSDASVTRELADARILLVDDHRPNLLAFQAVLEPLGYPIISAESAAAALRLLATEEVAVIVCDIRMPGIDGLEMMSRLRSEGLAALCEIILVSAVEMDHASMARAYALGAIDVLVKPIEPDLLRWRVGGLASLYRRRAAGPWDRDASSDYSAARAAAIATEAERLIRQKDLFVGMLGHDLRTPLAGLTLASQRLAAAKDLPDRYRRTAERLVHSTARMDRMIRDLVDFARTSAGASFPIRPRFVNLRDLVSSVTEELRDAHPDRPIMVSADQDLDAG